MRTFATGLAFRRPETHAAWHGSRLFRGSADDLATVVHRLAVVHNQAQKGSCVGQGFGQMIEGVTGERVSSVRLWEAGRILQGQAGDADVGTRAEYVIRWLERHGWVDYEPGEDTRPTAADTDHRIADSPADAIRAHHRRGRAILHQVIDTSLPVGEVTRQVIAALRLPRHEAGFGSGCHEGYFNPPPDVVLDVDFRGGNRNLHYERIVGWDAQRQAFIIQGSWGRWTWCKLPDGTVAWGCCLVTPRVLAAAREIDVVEVLP